MVEINCLLEECKHNKEQMCAFDGVIILENPEPDDTLLLCDEYDNEE